MSENYVEINSKAVDSWVLDGWEYGRVIDHETFVKAQKGEWSVILTPVKPVPREWFGDLNGKKVLGLASGGGQQMPIFKAAGAECTVLDYSQQQLKSEVLVAKRENYEIEIVRADMTQPLPFADEIFDLIFHPVSNCFVKDVCSIWRECYRVLKHGGVLLAGLDNGINLVFNEDETGFENKLPFDPLSDPELYKKSIDSDWGIQFSHTIEEQVGGQLKAGFVLQDIFQDTNNSGNLFEYNVPTFFATKSIKP